jgi:hypothetical protein
MVEGPHSKSSCRWPIDRLSQIHRDFQASSKPWSRLEADDLRVATLSRQSEMALVRDTAVQRLRDLTIAVTIAAAAGVALIAWVSAATIPGTNDTSGVGGNGAATGGPTTPVDDEGFGPAPQGTGGNGPGIAVSGGSH